MYYREYSRPRPWDYDSEEDYQADLDLYEAAESDREDDYFDNL